MKRTLATITTTAAITLGSLVAAPAAQAQSLTDLLGNLVAGAIDSTDCSTLRVTLETIDANTEGVLLDANTTRNQLSTRLNNLGKANLGTDPIMLAVVKYTGQTADRALECGIVKKDSTLLPDFGLSSKLNDYGPILTEMGIAKLSSR